MTSEYSETDFGPESLPYGVFTVDGIAFHVGTRLGDRVFDLAAIASAQGHRLAPLFGQPSLGPLMAAGPDSWREARAWVREAVPSAGDEHSHPLTDVRMRLPFEVADYVDFYASEFHASNVGRIFRPNAPDLPAAWRHLPIGYHGRAGTVVVSGTDVVRPSGQRRPGDDGVPGFGPTLRLDIECEVGFVVGQSSQLGTAVAVQDAKDYIFGIVLLNDWSARDIQAWEYVPLGPFLGKSFATSVSAWVTPMAALDDAHIPLPGQSPVLPYLAGDESTVYGLDLDFTVLVNGQVVSQPHYKDMYWSHTQMLAHLTVNGASLRLGDLFASGTVSGPERESCGSLLERTWNGTQPVVLDGGRELTFLEDGDTVTIVGRARGADGTHLALGEVTGTIVGGR